MVRDISDDLGTEETITSMRDRVRTREAEPRQRGGDRRLDAETRRRIGRSLRVLYAGLLAQPIPERFEALVAEFAARSEEESTR